MRERRRCVCMRLADMRSKLEVLDVVRVLKEYHRICDDLYPLRAGVAVWTIAASS